MRQQRMRAIALPKRLTERLEAKLETNLEDDLQEDLPQQPQHKFKDDLNQGMSPDRLRVTLLPAADSWSSTPDESHMVTVAAGRCLRDVRTLNNPAGSAH